jgi:hypothetical protein
MKLLRHRSGKQPDRPKPVTEEELEQLAKETFAERVSDQGRVPDRRRPRAPVWYPPGYEKPESTDA